MVTKNKKKFANKAVKYAVDWYAETDNVSTTLLPNYAYKSVVCSHTKRYHNCLYLLAGISSCTRDVMDFIAEEMDEDNVISTNSYFRNKFRERISTLTKGDVKYCDSSVKKSLHILNSKGLIRNIRRGYSMVNPEYFWKNDDTNRDKTISLELEFSCGADSKLSVLQKEHGIKAIVKR